VGCEIRNLGKGNAMRLHFDLHCSPLHPFESVQVREKQGFPPLTIVVVGLIYSRHSQAKLSSTDLREADAAGTHHTT
jgi:hypothetical protein